MRPTAAGVVQFGGLLGFLRICEAGLGKVELWRSLGRQKRGQAGQTVRISSNVTAQQAAAFFGRRNFDFWHSVRVLFQTQPAHKQRYGRLCESAPPSTVRRSLTKQQPFSHGGHRSRELGEGSRDETPKDCNQTLRVPPLRRWQRTGPGGAVGLTREEARRHRGLESSYQRAGFLCCYS